MTMIRKEDGTVRKENPLVTAQMESDIIRYRTAINRAELMLSLKDHPGWVAIQEVLEEKVKGVERQLDGFDKQDHRSIDLLMQERKNLRFFIQIVDDFTASMDGFEHKITQLEKSLSERRKQTASV